MAREVGGPDQVRGSQRRAQRVFVLSTALLWLSACVETNYQLGVSETRSGAAEILYVRCIDRSEYLAVIQVELLGARTQRDNRESVVWRVTNPAPQEAEADEAALLRFVVGELPAGFEQEIALNEPLDPERHYRVSVRGPGIQGLPDVEFKPGNLNSNEILTSDGETKSRRDFLDRARDACDGDPPFLGEGTLGVLALIGILVFALIVMALMGIIILVRSGWHGRTAP